jgi:hypothetical protein
MQHADTRCPSRMLPPSFRELTGRQITRTVISDHEFNAASISRGAPEAQATFILGMSTAMRACKLAPVDPHSNTYSAAAPPHCTKWPDPPPEHGRRSHGTQRATRDPSAVPCQRTNTRSRIAPRLQMRRLQLEVPLRARQPVERMPETDRSAATSSWTTRPSRPILVMRMAGQPVRAAETTESRNDQA